MKRPILLLTLALSHCSPDGLLGIDHRCPTGQVLRSDHGCEPLVDASPDRGSEVTCEDRFGTCLKPNEQTCLGEWTPADGAACPTGLSCCLAAIDAGSPDAVDTDTNTNADTNTDTGPTECENNGGECVKVEPNSCQNGSWSVPPYACGSPSLACCLPAIDAGHPIACETAGGSCVAVTPTSCTDGTWGAMQDYTCGGGLGVGCCLPKE